MSYCRPLGSLCNAYRAPSPMCRFCTCAPGLVSDYAITLNLTLTTKKVSVHKPFCYLYGVIFNTVPTSCVASDTHFTEAKIQLSYVKSKGPI